VTVHRATREQEQLLLSLTPSRLSLTIESTPSPTVINFDLAGRPWSFMRQGVFYQRGLNGRIIAKWIDASRGRGRRWLSEAEADDLVREIHQSAVELYEKIERNKLHFTPELENETLKILDRIARSTPDSLATSAGAFQGIYKPVGILPPDQYQAVLLQATEGCSYNKCTFCTFYKDSSFHIKDVAEFRSHCQSVHDYLGRGLSLRRTIFLGDANALVIPPERLLQLLSVIHETFDVEKLGGIFAFQDGFSGKKKNADEYHQLHALGLERVYIGLESGHDPLLEFLRKPGASEDALQTVRALKAAGVGVGVIILLGAGGRVYADGHVRDTIRVLNEMQLDLNDQIYFSELIEAEGMSYSISAYQSGLHPLMARDRLHQGEQIEAGLQFTSAGGTPHISRYDIREFVY
jgi:radical SAM superfamily enzyme YgiQ (UPF0313 family)